MYVRRTRQMNDTLRAHGLELDMRPILRIRYNTWDALAAGRSTLRPAPHLAAAFGQPTITTPDFAAAWQQVLREQRRLLAQVAAIRKPVELLTFLANRDPNGLWEQRTQSYQAARHTLRAIRTGTLDIQEEVARQQSRLKEYRALGLSLQVQRGTHFRGVSNWTAEETSRRAEFARQMRANEEQKRQARHEIAALNERRARIERGAEASAARVVMANIENEAELARLQLVRNALLTIEGLTHTNHRPSAWWFPMLDSSGEWFNRIVATAELYAEPLLS